MLMVDEHGRVTLANSQATRLFGYTQAELFQQPVDILVPDRYRVAHPGHLAGFFRHPVSRAMGEGRDLYALRKDGTEFPVEIGLNPLQTTEGVFVLASIIDITERKRTEETLRRSQEQLAGVIGSAMDAIITVDGAQRIVMFNAAAERMFLCHADEAIGQSLERFIPERFRATHHLHIQHFGRTNVTRRTMGSLGAIFGLRSDGKEFPIAASISQLESGGQKFYTVILRDITERNRAEQALRASEARFSIAFNASPISSVIATLNEGRYVAVNDKFLSLTGYKREEIIGRTSAELRIWLKPEARAEVTQLLLKEGQIRNRETKYRMKNGEERVFLTSADIIELDGQPHLITASIDITDRKQAEEEVHKLNEELEQRVVERTAELGAANRELEAFSYSVSHDLRAPLRHINGFSQMLLEDCSDRLDEAGKKYLSEVCAASQEMAQLIDDLLQLARVTRSEMRREVVNLTDIARDILTELQRKDTARMVAVDISEGLLTHGDKRLLKVVLTNLLGNAWKFTAKREEARIAFGQESKNGEQFFYVRDNGAGFDMAYANKLFGAFQRLHSGREFEGTGIGLATVLRIVHRHGGDVRAEGAVDKGATFYFRLPNFKEI
jgi:PAS domain S-box-containing protein